MQIAVYTTKTQHITLHNSKTGSHQHLASERTNHFTQESISSHLLTQALRSVLDYSDTKIHYR